MEEVARVPLSSVWGHKMRRTATKLKPDKANPIFHILSYYPVGHRAPGSQDQGPNEIQKGSGHLWGYREHPAITGNANKENLERIWKRSWAFGWKPLSNYKGLGWKKVWGWQRRSMYLSAKGCHVLPCEAVALQATRADQWVHGETLFSFWLIFFQPAPNPPFIPCISFIASYISLARNSISHSSRCPCNKVLPSLSPVLLWVKACNILPTTNCNTR